jgi:hypothetical protein
MIAGKPSGDPSGNPWALADTHARLTTNRVAHGSFPWANIETHTLPIRIGCPWADVLMGRNAGLTYALLHHF